MEFPHEVSIKPPTEQNLLPAWTWNWKYTSISILELTLRSYIYRTAGVFLGRYCSPAWFDQKSHSSRKATMQSYIGSGYPVMFFNMASRGGSWYDALHRGVVDARPGQLLQAPVQVVRRPTRHFIADILDLRDDNDDIDETMARSTTNSVPPGKHARIWTSLSPSPPSLSSNADDMTTSPGSEQRSAEDLRLTTMTSRHHSAGSDSRSSDSPPSDVDVDCVSDCGTFTSPCNTAFVSFCFYAAVLFCTL